MDPNKNHIGFESPRQSTAAIVQGESLEPVTGGSHFKDSDDVPLMVQIMKALIYRSHLKALSITMAVALLAMISGVAVAEDGAALYKSKCAMCHGAAGEGKVGPALKGTKLTEAQVADLLTKGEAGKKAPHGKAVAGLTEEQAKAVATFVKGLK